MKMVFKISNFEHVCNYAQYFIKKTLNYAIKTLKNKKQIFATCNIQICEKKKFLVERHRVIINDFKQARTSKNRDEKLYQF